MTIVVRFGSEEAPKAWYESDAYQKIGRLRIDNSEGLLTVCDESKMPS